jgi:hypothetical protein
MIVTLRDSQVLPHLDKGRTLKGLRVYMQPKGLQ